MSDNEFFISMKRKMRKKMRKEKITQNKNYAIKDSFFRKKKEYFNIKTTKNVKNKI